MTVSKAALALVLAGTGLTGFTTEAAAQQQNAQQPAARGQAAQGQAAPAPQRNFTLSRTERAALAPLLEAQGASNWDAVRTGLPAAQAAAQGTDAKYLVARVQFALATHDNNEQAQTAGIDAIIASGGATPEELPQFLNLQAERAFARQDFATAERAFVRLQQLTPNDPRITSNLAIVRARQGNNSGALDTVVAEIRQQEAAGQAVPQASYQRALALATAARNTEVATQMRNTLLTRFPSPQTWRGAIDATRQGNTDDAFTMDALRLMRAAGALVERNDYLAYAQMAARQGLPGELSAVISEGQQRNLYPAGDGAFTSLRQTAERGTAEDRRDLPGAITSARRPTGPAREALNTADALYGYGRYREAVELYRVAQTRGGLDANMLNLRIGGALAQAGDRAGAETAFRTVTGPRQGLAELWIAWLSRRPA